MWQFSGHVLELFLMTVGFAVVTWGNEAYPVVVFSSLSCFENMSVKGGKGGYSPCFQHEAIASGYLVLCFCNFLVSVATSHVIQAVLSAAMVSVQELVLYPTWVTMQQVESWVSGCNSKFLELPQVLICLRVICRIFLVWFNWVVSVNFVVFVCMQGQGRFCKCSVFTWT